MGNAWPAVDSFGSRGNTIGSGPYLPVCIRSPWDCCVADGTSVTYNFNDTGAIPLSLLEFTHGSTSLTSRALWGGIVSRITFNFNGSYLTMDVSGAGGYAIDSTGFSAFDTQAKAGLTSFPIEPSSPTINGLPIAGFGTGYTATLDSQDLSLKVLRARHQL